MNRRLTKIYLLNQMDEVVFLKLVGTPYRVINQVLLLSDLLVEKDTIFIQDDRKHINILSDKITGLNIFLTVNILRNEERDF